jgi:hypothetical protein
MDKWLDGWMDGRWGETGNHTRPFPFLFPGYIHRGNNEIYCADLNKLLKHSILLL